MSDLNLSNEEQSSLERFKRRLERDDKNKLKLRPTTLPKSIFDLKRNWDNDDISVRPVVEKIGEKSHWLLKFFIGTLIFFLATVAVAVYVLFYSANIVSPDSIDLTVKGPTQLRSGDELSLETTILNRNKATLRDLSLTVTYPAGTVDSLETSKELPLWRENIPELGPGQQMTIASRAIIFGAQNSQQIINLKVEYHIPDSNAVFTKETTYQIQIGSATLDLSLDLPSEINAGKTFTAKLKAVSNAKSILRQVSVKMEYPNGFTFQSTDLANSNGHSVWYLGDLTPGASREIQITGTLSGQNEEVKSFKVSAGLDKTEGSGDLSTEYGSFFKTVNLKKDFVAVGIDLNNQNSLSADGRFTGGINWTNNLPDKVIDGTLELFLAGEAIDKKTVVGEDGFYNSLTNSITWDKNSISNLGLLNPGEKSQTGFGFSVLPLSKLPTGIVPPINLRLVFHGSRVTDEDNLEDITTEVEKTIKIGTQVQASRKATYYVGPFKNSGPIPPKVGSETTYTITWTVTNSSNPVKNAKMRAILPPYVKWLSVISPLDEKIIYNNTNSDILWDLGDIEPSTGVNLPAREVSFQISIIPSLTQAGKAVDLVNEVSFEGEDGVTGDPIKIIKAAQDTRLLLDPSYHYGLEIVTQ